MAERKDWSESDLKAAWNNSKGHCPEKWCELNQKLLSYNDYGIKNNSSWVVDHKIALAKGGTNNQQNLQAMHNYCNNQKGDK